tara:strand:- start:1495 stop:2328 length:834 start_codon:yes stop_codon:yes gene_type:complete
MAIIKNGIFATYNGQIITPQSLGISVAGIQTCQQFFTSGSLIETTQRYAVYALVADLENYGLWNKMKAIYPVVSDGINQTRAFQHKFNLKDPRDLDAAYRLVFTGGWTHSSNGILGNGTNNSAQTYYIQTNFLFGLSICNRTNSNKLAYDIGQQDTDPQAWTHLALGLGSTSIRARNNTNGNIDYNYGSTNVGFWQTNRVSTSTNGWNVNYNGAVVGQNSSFGNTLPTDQIIIGGNAGIYPDREYSFAAIHDGLTNTEASNFYTAVQRFQTTLGRQV